MKVLSPIFVGCLLLFILISTATAQDENKRAKLIPDTDAPWGLVVEFVDQTSIPQEKAMREKYGLRVSPCCYEKADPGLYLGQVFDESLYSGMERFCYTAMRDFDGDTRFDECLKDNSCPPVFVDRIWYEPVDTATELALLEEEIVRRLDNRRSTLFFYLKIIECWIENMKDGSYCQLTTPWA